MVSSFEVNLDYLARFELKVCLDLIKYSAVNQLVFFFKNVCCDILRNHRLLFIAFN